MEAFDTPEDRKFRLEVRQFFKDNLPDSIRQSIMTGLGVDRKTHDEWNAVMLKRGWSAPNMPKEYGGTAWTLKQQYIFDQER